MPQRRQLQRGIQAGDESIASAAATEGSPSEQADSRGGKEDYNSQEGKRMRDSEPTLPEDILYHIHSLLPLRDAARAACASHVFLNSWRCRPNLYFSMEVLGLKGSTYGNDKSSRDFTTIVDNILKKHSGFGLKSFQLAIYGYYAVNFCHLDSWLRLALTSGIEELIFASPSMPSRYDFPLSLLSGKNGNSIQYLDLGSCAFRPTVRLGCFRNLKRLRLSYVCITGDELGCLLPDSLALGQLELSYCNEPTPTSLGQKAMLLLYVVVVYCNEIICLKVPCVLLQLRYLEVIYCNGLQVIESKAPNLSSFCYKKWQCHHVHISLGLHVKKLEILTYGAFYYSQLPTILPNLETLTLTINSLCEVTSTPSVHSKFRQLKHLNIRVPGETHGPVYDYFSLTSFVDASPCLETFILHVHVPECQVNHGLFSGDPSHLRQMPDHQHERLKLLQIGGFYPAKSLLELARHVLESATSLECLALGTTYCPCKSADKDLGKCYLLAIGTYIEGKVPSTARLDIRGPCTGRVGFSCF